MNRGLHCYDNASFNATLSKDTELSIAVRLVNHNTNCLTTEKTTTLKTLGFTSSTKLVVPDGFEPSP